MRFLLMLLPTLRREWIKIDNNGMPTEFYSNWEGRALSIEWLNFGFVFYIGEVRPSVKKGDK